MKIKFELDAQIPKYIAIIVIMVAGLAIAWFTINIGSKIIQDQAGLNTQRNQTILNEMGQN